jgi:hypothetical protein
MSRGLGEMQIIALLALKAHAESDPPRWQSAYVSGFVPVHHLREHAWAADRYDALATYRGTPDSYRENDPNSFKRALDRLVAIGYVEFRYDESSDHCHRRNWRNQYRLTERGLSVLPKLPNTYPTERLTVEHPFRAYRAFRAAT